MKRLLFSWFLALMMLLSLFPVTAFADNGSGNSTSNSSIVFKKELINETGSIPNIRLEAYTTGSITTESVTIPTDIVLVLDQSGSMTENNKLATMKTAVESFVKGIAELNTGNDATTYRVAIVGFASQSDYGDNTEILTMNGQTIKTVYDYTEIDRDDLNTRNTYYILDGNNYREVYWRSNRNDWYTSQGNDRVANNAVFYRRTSRQTVVDSGKPGLNYNDLDDNTVYESALINCTTSTISSAGTIGKAINALDAEGATEADLGMEMAQSILDTSDSGRNKVVVLLTDGTPTTWTEFDEGVADRAIGIAKDMKDDGVHIFSMYLGSPASDSRRFLQAVSSNYPNATSYDNLGSATASSYYSAHSNSSAIQEVFGSIITSVASNSQLSETSVVTDTIAPQFALPAGANTDQIRVYTVDKTGPNENDWASREVPLNTAAVVLKGEDNKKIEVTGFNFSYHCVTTKPKDGTGGTNYGKKLVIYIPIAEDTSADSFGGWLATNTDAGIVHGGTKVAGDDSCYLDVSMKYSMEPAERFYDIGTGNQMVFQFNETNMNSVFDEMIKQIPNGKNNAGVNMSYELIDTNNTQGAGDDTVIASLTIPAGGNIDATDFRKWRFTQESTTLTIPDNANYAEKGYVLLCQLTSTKPGGMPAVFQTYEFFDIAISRQNYHIVYGEIDNGGTITIGGLVVPTYSQVVAEGGSSDTMIFAPADGYEIYKIYKHEDIEGVTHLTTIYDADNNVGGNIPVDEKYTFQAENVQHNTGIEVLTRLKEFTLTTSADDGSSISPEGPYVYPYSSTMKLPVDFSAKDGYRITSLTVNGTRYSAADLLEKNAAELTQLGISITTAEEYTSNSNTAQKTTVITGGSIHLPRTQNNDVSVTSTENYYKLTYQYYHQTGSEQTRLKYTHLQGADESSLVLYGGTRPLPTYLEGAENNGFTDCEGKHHLHGWYTSYVYTGEGGPDEFYGQTDLTDAEMPASDLTLYSFWEKNPDITVADLTIHKIVNGLHTDDETFNFSVAFHQMSIAERSLKFDAMVQGSVPSDDDLIKSTQPIPIVLTDAQHESFHDGTTSILIREMPGGKKNVWTYDTNVFGLKYDNGQVVLYNVNDGREISRITAGANTDHIPEFDIYFYNNLIPTADLAVEKVIDSKIDNNNNGVTDAGDELTWKITVKNNGNAPTTFTLKDTLTDEMTGDTVVDDLAVFPAPASGTPYSIAAGETLTFTAEYTVQATDAGKTLVNTVVVTDEGGNKEEDKVPGEDIAPYKVIYKDGANSSVFTDEVFDGLGYGDATPAFDFNDGENGNQDPERDGYDFDGWDPAVAEKVTGNAIYVGTWSDSDTREDYSLTITKTVDKSTANVGDVLKYTITVKNTGKNDLTNVKISDNMAPDGKFGAFETGAVLSADSDAVTFEYTYVVTDSDVGTLKNTVTAEADGTDEVSDDAVTTVEQPSDGGSDDEEYELRITKTVDKDEAEFGDILEYTIIVENIGDNTLTDIRVKDEMLDVNEKIDKLEVGERERFKYEYKVKASDTGKMLTNTATARANGESDSDSAVTKISNRTFPDMKVTKTVDKETAKVGDILTYTITVENTGNTDLYRIQIADTMMGADRIIVTLEPGEKDTFTYHYQVQEKDEGKLLENTVFAVVDDIPDIKQDTVGTKIDPSSGGGSSVPLKPKDPPALNKEDHISYIVGYPEDYRTGKMTNDESLWPVKPQANITRAEVASIFFRLLKDQVRDGNLTTANTFSDVNYGEWYNTAISTMAALDIVSGYPDGTFRPNQKITRAELATIAARFSDAVPSLEYTFPDVTEAHWARNFISMAYELGWVTGYPDGTYKPDRYITRAETVSLINRVLERVPRTVNDLHASMHVWPDNRDSSQWYYIAIQEASCSHEYVRNDPKPAETWTKLTADPDWSRYTNIR